MSFYLVAGAGARTCPVPVREHLPTARPRRYPSDTTDEEWEIIAGLCRSAAPPAGVGVRCATHAATSSTRSATSTTTASCGGRCRSTSHPGPPSTTTFGTWTRDGTLTRLHHSLREQVRHAEGRRKRPVRGNHRLTIRPRCRDRSRAPAAASTPARRSTAANATSRSTPAGCCWPCWSPPPVCKTATPPACCCGRCAPAFPASAWSGPTAATPANCSTWAATTLKLTVQIVRKLAGQAGFTVLPRRWVAERTFSWINRCRRTVRDYERLPDHHAAMVQWSMVIIMTRRLARYRTTSRSPTTQTA